MKILFGPYGSVLSSLGVPTDVLAVKRSGQQKRYRIAVEMIAKGYVNAGATLPTVNGFFLRPLLKAGFTELYQEMLSLNLEALLSALGSTDRQKIAICLGPVNDCYQPEQAPSSDESYLFAKRQYELCLEVLTRFGFLASDVFFLHETIGTGREALGLSRAAQSVDVPLILSFVVNCDGFLLSSEPVEEVIQRIDAETSHFVEGFSLNCCSPHALDRVAATFKNKNRLGRFIGFYPNSCDANPSIYETGETLVEPHKVDSLKLVAEKGREYSLRFVGGCCGFGYYDVKLLAALIYL